MTLISAYLFVYLRFGKDNFPFLLNDMDSEIIVMEDTLTPESATELSRQVAGSLASHQYPKEIVNRAALFTEEIGLTILESNQPSKKPILIELSLFFEDDQDEVDDFFIFSRNESVNAEDHTPESKPAAVESQDIPPWEEYPAEKPSSSAEVVQPVPHATDRNSEETQNQNSVQTTDQTADKSDDDDFFDDVMSSPWIKKL